jgi:hypothetical protein
MAVGSGAAFDADSHSERMPNPVNPVENGDKQEICHQPLLAKDKNSFLVL